MDLGDSNLEAIKLLGEGIFGRVFLCRIVSNEFFNSYVCVKQISRSNEKCNIKMILEEVYINSHVEHPNVVQFMRSFVHEDTVNIVMEHVTGGTMRSIIKKARRVAISVSSLKRYTCDILMGLEYLHMRNIIHRDLKPENLLITADRHVKIADFGIASIYKPECPENFKILGTPFYLAPEVMEGTCCDFKSDIWSFGCVLYEMCEAVHPFAKAKDLRQLKQMIAESTQNNAIDCRLIASNYGQVFAQMCEKMLVYDANQRISLPNILLLDGTFTIPFYAKYFDYNYHNKIKSPSHKLTKLRRI